MRAFFNFLIFVAMRKILLNLSLGLALTAGMFAFVSCGGSGESHEAPATQETAPAPDAAAPAAADTAAAAPADTTKH